MTPLVRLKTLCEFEFVRRVSFASTPMAMREAIRQTDEFQALSDDLRAGTLTTSNLEAFVNELFTHFTRGVRFAHEEAAAAVVILVETHFSKFADELLTGLATLDSAEMPMLTGIARECLRTRTVHVASSTFARVVAPSIERPETISFKMNVPSPRQVQSSTKLKTQINLKPKYAHP